MADQEGGQYVRNATRVKGGLVDTHDASDGEWSWFFWVLCELLLDDVVVGMCN